MDDLQSVLDDTESTCLHFVNELDGILSVLEDVSNAHADVTGRTNILMHNCENLLEQKVINNLIFIFPY